MSRERARLEVYTGNLAFTNSRRADRADLRTLAGRLRDHAGVLLLQELSAGGRHLTDLDAMLGPAWAIHQGRGDRSATAVVALGTRIMLAGYAEGITPPPGVKLNHRLISWADVDLDGRTVRPASVHFPPERFPELWPIYADNVAHFVRSSPHPVILGGDWNAPISGGQVGDFTRSLGMVRHGRGIDGFVYSRELRAGPMELIRNDDTRSDHPFVGTTFRWC